MPDVTATKEAIAKRLRSISLPDQPRDVVSSGFVRGVSYCDGVARIMYELPAALMNPPAQEHLHRETLTAIMAVDGLKSVNVEFATQPPPRSTNTLPGVKHVIAVGAGKGGVGKSTVAVLLAAGMQRMGLKVGLLDADVYGPSLPMMTGTGGMQPYADESGRIVPPEFDGIKIMSMGFIVPPDQAVVWRGPMAQKYVKEFLDRGDWGDLDYLIVDLPPGTGDIPLTLAQSIPLSGAVLVCTPQDVALLDAMKALRMYQKLGVEPLGIVENMSYYLCPHCGHRDEIFSHGGAEQAARESGVPFLGGIPLNAAIRVSGDAGLPFENFTKAEPYVITALNQVVKRVIDEVETHTKQRMPLPQLKIV
ncbi:antiporter inner membrane protein [Phycisphaerae bacterium RAS1]|nr:antiporter inner membrane protein [Phycisphaerae bacterium RAS1]